MRFSRLSTIALLSLLSLAVATPSWSQTSAPGKAGAEPAPGKADPSAPPAATPTEAPEEEQQNFGPRVQPPEGAQGQQQPAGPPPTIVGTYGNWQVQCADAPAGAEGGPAKQCGMVQGTQSEKDPEVGLSLIIVLAKEGDKTMTMMRVLVPVGRVPFTRCLPQVCEAFAEASPETLAKLKKGKTANFIIYEAPGLGMPLKIELKGFSEGLDTLGKQS